MIYNYILFYKFFFYIFQYHISFNKAIGSITFNIIAKIGIFYKYFKRQTDFCQIVLIYFSIKLSPFSIKSINDCATTMTFFFPPKLHTLNGLAFC